MVNLDGFLARVARARAFSEELDARGYRDMLKWAAGDRARLAQIAFARGYPHSWVLSQIRFAERERAARAQASCPTTA
jgi:hypothetical protein